MTMIPCWACPALILVALGLPGVLGCNDLNSSRDDRTGRGAGDQLPNTGSGAQGTNATTGEITTGGPGSKVVGKNITSTEGAPSGSTPYGGDGAGAAPPVTPAKGAPASGDSNSGQTIGKDQGPGADASTGSAKPSGGASGPGTGTPPR